VNIDNTTHNPGAGWRLLGELELPAGASVEDALHAWLTVILLPLNLQAELVNKIIASAQDAIARVIHADTMLKFEHIHLTVFVPSTREGKEQAWGFFRLEKIEDTKEEPAGGDHAVEFYLYGEGE
jgi:hypothetical protein